MATTESQIIKEQQLNSPQIKPLVNNHRKWARLIVLSIFFILILILIYEFFLHYQQLSTKPIVATPTPTIEATPGAKKKLSSIALDPSFTILEKDLQQLSDNLTNVDLNESKLALPILELNVSFEKQ